MNFDNFEDLGNAIYDFVRDQQRQIYGDSSLDSILLYVLCAIHGSMNYAPHRAKDCDVHIALSPMATRRVAELPEYTFKGLRVDYNSTTIAAMDSVELIELISVVSDREKVFFKDNVSRDNGRLRKPLVKALSRRQIRHEVSKKCSNSFVKAKKKLLVEKDYNREVSMKSLWHSIRMYDFACQYGKDGRIIDFGSCNDLYDEIVQDYETHDDMEILDLITKKYKPMQNRAASLFKIYFPK